MIAASVFAVDLALVAAAFLVAHAIRRVTLPELGLVPGPFYPVEAYLPLLPLALLLWAAFLLSSGTYRSHRTVSLAREIRDLARTAVLSGLSFSLLIFFLRLDQLLLGSDRISRSWVFVFVVIAFLFHSMEKLLLRTVARHLRSRGYNYRKILIVGTGPLARTITESIASHRFWGYQILGMVGAEPLDAEPLEDGLILGPYADLIRIIDSEAVDEIILTVDYLQHPELEEALLHVQDLGVIIRFAFDPFPTSAGKLHLSELDGIPLVTWSRTPGSHPQLLFKRSVDLLVAVTLLLLTLPVFLVISIGIKLSSKGPVLFRQTRAGLNGRTFTLLKFRTMIQDAEQYRSKVEALNEMSGPVFKMKNDPRVTLLGAFLRRFSLDELPQLWNVVKGNMSLVGPRPPIPEEVDRYDRWQKRRLSMRPGLTCLWQVGGRNAIDFDRWMELDLAYIDNWSPWLDLKILVKTIPVVFSGKGAY
jgi:exopolysaccharide biosynthesis polyprenyl glycosylphosphotransferase